MPVTPVTKFACDTKATRLPSPLMEGAELAPLTARPLPLTETRSVLGWMANNTEPIAVLPVLSVTVTVAVEVACCGRGAAHDTRTCIKRDG